MRFEDKVRKHLGKKGEEGGVEKHRRENLIAIITSKAGALNSVPFDKIDTADLFKLANALSGDIRRR